MYIDEPTGAADETVAWGSDVAAQMLRRFGIRYVSLNPGASYRGLHDSLVNHLGNRDPGIILCLHEDHAVAIAHGYAKVTGEPMACVLHSNVGLMHGMVSLYNAWCDRAPMFVLGATGPLDAAERRPWIDWLHTTRDQGALVRSFIKWDDQPSSAEALVESMCRANMLTRTEPTAPVYVCLDAGLQEARLASVPSFPDLGRFAPPMPARPARSAVSEACALLSRAERPLMMVGRGRRTPDAWNARIRLAERLGACVVTDLRTASMFPTDHPAHVAPPVSRVGKAVRELIAAADVILALGWVDLAGDIRSGDGDLPRARIVGAGQDHVLHNGFNMDYQALPPIDVNFACPPDEAVVDLLEELGPGRRDPWRTRQAEPPAEIGNSGPITLVHVATTLRSVFEDPDRVSFAALCRGWPSNLWPLRDPVAYLGKDGGAGIGSGPGLSIGAALALQHRDRFTVAVLGDGDFAMGCNALWTAVHHRIPLMTLINNNRSYFNDELHQETVARRRGRDPGNRWIGQALREPDLDLAKLAEAQGAVGIGPVRAPGDLRAALEEGAAVLRGGGVSVIDIHVPPGQERHGAASLAERKTGA
jgi:thiamine pyrophosphate-dependent acetolactate synthase large subunit-like protein